ncbi:hypothetical protein N656DRAFT_776382 [Canariomyces notabilis]|uniref:Uncharacterized protein n=1 Tax=Canariomyces notabilis TaxID=2074819 RepID=A0AAN6YV81_9PEZI|nr:hypothetical protein N656DRAFT_776382 [Canariomyces arenarius]
MDGLARNPYFGILTRQPSAATNGPVKFLFGRHASESVIGHRRNESTYPGAHFVECCDEF